MLLVSVYMPPTRNSYIHRADWFCLPELITVFSMLTLHIVFSMRCGQFIHSDLALGCQYHAKQEEKRIGSTP